MFENGKCILVHKFINPCLLVTHLSGESPDKNHTDSLFVSLRVIKTWFASVSVFPLGLGISEVIICEI